MKILMTTINRKYLSKYPPNKFGKNRSIFGKETIGSYRLFILILILFTKFVLLILSYKISMVSNLDKNTRIILSLGKFLIKSSCFPFSHLDSLRAIKHHIFI